nr:MAG TPA_asm: hypothetical protein [Caudoviricetes sp.]
MSSIFQNLSLFVRFCYVIIFREGSPLRPHQKP